jgi:hypothetical protein
LFVKSFRFVDDSQVQKVPNSREFSHYDVARIAAFSKDAPYFKIGELTQI